MKLPSAHFPLLESLAATFSRACGWSWALGMVPLSLLADPVWLPADFPAAPAEGSMLCQRDYLTPEQAREVQDAMLEAFPDKASWDAHAADLRRRLQEGLGLDPWPEKTPLRAIFSDRREYDGYSVENVAFETVPGYWVAGNLYRPRDQQPPFAGVLHPHGHSIGPEKEGWIKHGRFKEDVQRRAATLARMGAVSLTIDMFAYGDQRAELGPDAHRTPIAQRMQIWNGIRALDFLTSLPDVDPARLAVTGHSGGGTQTFLLTAIDERVAVSAPVAMVSGWFFGGCPCESGLPIHRSAEHFMNNATIAALAAPRPQLIVSDGGDWTHLVPELEFPFIQKIYAYDGAEDQLKNVHLPDEGHNYGPSKRAALYPFFQEHLALHAAEESGTTVEDPALMRFFDAGHPVPENALRTPEAIDAVLWSLQKGASR